MPSSTTPLTTRSSALAAYTAAHTAGASPAQWNDISTALLAADAGRGEVYVLDRARDARMQAITVGQAAAYERQLIPVLQLAETYAVVGPMATSLHAGFLDIERAFDCAARLTEHTQRPHTVKAVPTAPQRKQLIPVLAVEVVA